MLEWLEAHQLSCWIKSVIGIECPGCGMQRAVLLLIKGEFLASFRIYPGLFHLLIFNLAVMKISGIKKIQPGLLKIMGFVCLAIILISYLLKLTIVIN